MKHIWLLLFIFACTSSEPVPPQIDNIEYLSYTKPDKKKGYGNYVSDILYTGEISYSKMNSIIDIFNKTYPKRCFVRVWNSKEAFYQDKNGKYGKAFKSGLILAYSKNVNNDINVIKWLQEEGELSDLFGTQTNL